MADVGGEAWGFAGVVAGGALALAGKIIAGRVRREETTAERIRDETAASTRAMEVVFAEGRVLLESIKVDRDAWREEALTLRQRVRDLEGGA